MVRVELVLHHPGNWGESKRGRGVKCVFSSRRVLSSSTTPLLSFFARLTLR